jgi:hypothetical protein
MYKVILVPATCGQTALDTGTIETNLNSMHAQGFELTHIYQTSAAGCVGAKTAAVMVFKKRL